jgi:hypothetical protein
MSKRQAAQVLFIVGALIGAGLGLSIPFPPRQPRELAIVVILAVFVVLSITIVVALRVAPRVGRFLGLALGTLSVLQAGLVATSIARSEVTTTFHALLGLSPWVVAVVASLFLVTPAEVSQ